MSFLHWALQNTLSYLRDHSNCLNENYSIYLFILLVTCQAYLELDLGTGLLQSHIFNQRSHPTHSRIFLFFWQHLHRTCGIPADLSKARPQRKLGRLFQNQGIRQCVGKGRILLIPMPGIILKAGAQ